MSTYRVSYTDYEGDRYLIEVDANSIEEARYLALSKVGKEIDIISIIFVGGIGGYDVV